jgi:TetR/AcrR family transcriptional regulator
MSSAQNLSQGARAILQAASELFAQESFASVSVGAIAARAGVSKSNVFHHFASKEELFLAVMREAGASHAEFAEQLLAEPGACLPKLHRLIDFEIDDFFANPHKTQLVLRALSNQSAGNGHQLAAGIFQRNFRAVVALLADGQRRGELRGDFDPETAAMILGGANEMILRMHGFVQDSLVRQADAAQRRAILQAYVDSVFDILLHGIRLPDPIDTISNDHALLRKPGTSHSHKESQCR